MLDPSVGIGSVLQLIGQVSAEHPLAVALSLKGEHLTYSDLETLSGRFAGYLTKLGVQSGSSVALCMDRSFDYIIAAYSIMRVGATYVPLDPQWPDSRLRYAIEDSRALLIVANQPILERLNSDARGVDLAGQAAAIRGCQILPFVDVAPAALAYMIYTSGSTGYPKGVEITHANLLHLVNWHLDAFQVRPGDRVSHLAGLGFDAAVWEIWPSLCAGATLCLADDETRSSPELLQRWILQEKVTISFVPTSIASQVIRLSWPQDDIPFRTLLTGGDQLHQSQPLGLPFQLVNNYGPSECTVVATSGVVLPGSMGKPSIGRPINGARIYVLDEYRQEVPLGEIGEIYIGGAGVGKGYGNLPELTDRTFVPDPFAGHPGARMYRTGDVGLFRQDGELEFIGRLDRQVQIQGQRVELDEIATLLSQHPSLAFATTQFNSADSPGRQLIAFVLVRDASEAITTSDLQAYLLKLLPSYMVPNFFVNISSIPLSSNGKIDFSMLPSPENWNLLGNKISISVLSPVEAKLLNIVQDLVDDKTLSIQDNFFIAGGHSLLAMQLVMRTRETFGVDLTLRQLFDASTVQLLAILVENQIIDSMQSMTEEEAAAYFTD